MSDLDPAAPIIELVARYFQARTGVAMARAERHVGDAIRKAMREGDHSDPQQYLAALERDAATFDALVERLTVGESYFFRDEWHFDLVAERVLPEAAARAEAGGPGLRAWSAGCAAGEELYSLAIVLAERDALAGAWLLGTDISSAALERARVGRYRDWSLRGSGVSRARAWMEREDGTWRLDPRIRSAVTFRPLNLARDLYPAVTQGTHELDVIFCRNVLIYFDAPTIETVARRLSEALRPGGWLLTGPSDPPLSALADLEPIVLDAGVAYKRPEPARARHPQAPTRDFARPRPAPAGPPPRRPERARGGSASVAAIAPDLVERLHRLAALDPALALSRVDQLLLAEPKNVALLMLRATLLVSVDRPAEAETALRVMIDLEPRSCVAHFMLASLRSRAGDRAGARAGWERALALLEDLPDDAVVPHSDGQPKKRIAEAARRQLEALDALETK